MLYDYEMTPGKRVQSARRRLRPKVSQQDLADKLGVTKSAVSNWERDIDPPDGYARELRKILQVRYDWLLDGTGDMEELTATEQEAVDALLAALRRTRAA